MVRSQKMLFVRWVEFVVVGKMIGIAAAIWVGGSALSRMFDLSPLTAVAAAVAVMAMAGFAEGTLVGLAQASVLGRAVPGVRSGSWAVTTGLGTAVAWAIAMRANLFALDKDLAGEELLLVVVVLGSVLGMIVGTAQWLHLRSWLPGAAGWIAVNAVAWVMGTLAAAGFLAFIGPESSGTEVVLIATLAGLAVGAAVGVITGAALVGLLHSSPPHSLTR